MTLDFRLSIPTNFQFRAPVIVPRPANPIPTPISVSPSSSSAAASSLVDKYQVSCYQWLEKKFTDLVANVHFFFHSFFYSTINPAVSKDILRNIYLGLGKDKWRECIDGCHHSKGKFVYDQGLHGGTIEKGFIASMENTFGFVSQYLNKKVDEFWYLKLHRYTCAHFNGDKSAFLMGQEKVGVFREYQDVIGCVLPDGVYRLTPEAKVEFLGLDREIRTTFGEAYGLGTLQDLGGNSYYLYYKQMTRAQVTTLFNKFLSDFYREVEQAPTQDLRLKAIAKLHQRLEWLHPVRDGTSRTSVAFLNKNLIDYGFHPAILDHPHVSTCYGLTQWTQYLKNGLVRWEQEKARKDSL